MVPLTFSDKTVFYKFCKVMPSFLTWIQSKYNDFMSRVSPKKYIYKYNYTCNRLPKNNLLKKSSEIVILIGRPLDNQLVIYTLHMAGGNPGMLFCYNCIL